MTRISAGTKCDPFLNRAQQTLALRAAPVRSIWALLNMLKQLERLMELGIEAAPVEGMTRHVVFARGGYAALVERTGDGFGRVGASGLMTSTGLAMLVWRDQRAYFVTRNGEQAATDEQVAALRSFSSDLERTLRAC
ncbi:MAG: hypothetical protein ABI972_15500 [Acidobacteriota bacterium]